MSEIDAQRAMIKAAADARIKRVPDLIIAAGLGCTVEDLALWESAIAAKVNELIKGES